MLMFCYKMLHLNFRHNIHRMGNNNSKERGGALEEGERNWFMGEVKKERDKRIRADKKFNLAYEESHDLREMVASLKRRVAELEGEKRGGRRSSI